MGRLNNLPRDILLEILTRLPTESVLDCKLVCKPWENLVRHPSFSQKHFNHLNYSTTDDDSGKLSLISTSNELGLEEFYYTEFEENCDTDEILLSRKTRMNLSPAFQSPLFMVGSCNGLVCFNLRCNGGFKSGFRFGPAYICNPITREYVILPDHDGVYECNGFGYCVSTNEYKVVRICLDSDDPKFGIAQVYTVGSGNGWRNVGGISNGMKWKSMKNIRLLAGAFANGALHWVNFEDGTVLAFCLADEKFYEFPPAPCLTPDGDPDFPFHLGVLGDFLSATYYHDTDSSQIWLLNKKNKDNSDLSWSKKFSLDKYVELAFEFMKSGRLLCCARGEIYSYDPKASSVRRDLGLDMSIFEAIRHRNTLVSLRALGEKDVKTMEFSSVKE